MENKPEKILINSKSRLKKYLKDIINIKDFKYTTFGSDIEDYISEELEKIFDEKGYTKHRRAKNKNEFPDFTLETDPKIAIDYKSGNTVKKANGIWIKCNNSNNDLGTMNEWPNKIAKFKDKIYYVFVIYKIKEDEREIIDVQIDFFYKFIGIGSKGLLKYRKKDGNLRPKDFYKKPQIKNFEEFKSLFEKTKIYRAKSIIRQHIETVPLKERKAFLKELEE